MLYFNNPKRKRAVKVRRRKRRHTAKRRVRVRRVARRSTTGGIMAARRKRRHVARRRRRSGRSRSGVRLVRRGVTVYQGNPRRRRRRHHRRNPFMGGGGGVVTTIKRGVIDGATVLAAQVATSKALALADRVPLPLPGIAGAAVKGLGVPIVITIVARKVLPGKAALISAAAFAQGLHTILAQTPIGGFLGAYPALGAYPMGTLGDGDIVDAGQGSQLYGYEDEFSHQQ